MKRINLDKRWHKYIGEGDSPFTNVKYYYFKGLSTWDQAGLGILVYRGYLPILYGGALQSMVSTSIYDVNMALYKQKI